MKFRVFSIESKMVKEIDRSYERRERRTIDLQAQLQNGCSGLITLVSRGENSIIAFEVGKEYEVTFAPIQEA